MSSIYGMIYDEIGAKIKHLPEYNTKIAKSVYDALDREAIADIILDGNIFWFESYNAGNNWNNAQHDWLVKYLRGKGYKYLYDMTA